jgi:hypothetical protein
LIDDGGRFWIRLSIKPSASAEALIAALRRTLEGLELRDYRTLLAAPEPGRSDLCIRS